MGNAVWSNGWWYELLRQPRVFLQMLTAMMLFAYGLPRRNHFVVRLAGCFIMGMGSIFLLEQLLPTNVATDYIFGSATAILAVWTISFCWRSSVSTICLVMSNGTLAYGIASALKIVLSITSPALDTASLPPVQMLLVDLLYCGVSYGALFIALKHRFRIVDSLDNKYKMFLSMLSIFAGQGIMSLRIGTAGVQDPSIAHYIYLVGVCILILIVQFSFAKRIQLGRDVDTMKELTRQQHLQFQASKENAQLISEKYHDLKQMIGALQNKSDIDVSALEKGVASYAAPMQTGNEILDVLLTEKRMVCAKENIAITCMVGGTDLAFVDDLDLYALFSNALTNAIEALIELPQDKSRFINLNVSRKGNMAIIHMENPCTGDVVFEDGLPISQRDRRYHGFGMQSMERTAEKYGGSMAADLRDNRFFLDIILFDCSK